ncbi:MAG TPA: glycosyltransferase family 39 protein [Terriglobales bacterium]|nr:glycosyltransferase family 39 protein [Terriglobales bacterium]
MLLGGSLLIALGIGLAIAWPLRPQAFDAPREFPLLLFLSLGLGLGATSLWFFLWLAIFGSHKSSFIASELILLAILGTMALVCPRHGKSQATSGPIPRSRFWYFPAVAFLAALVVAGTAFTRYSASAPHGAWDAWGDWNLRARFLYLGGGAHWTDVFSPLGTMPHRDYPLLLSATVARCWTYLKSDAQSAPIAIAFLFTFATAGELFCALSLLRSRSQGLIAATILLATPFFLVLGSAQYADVPLAFFFLSTIVLLCLHEQSGFASRRALTLAGAMASLAVWTKNEGGLFLSCLLVSYFLIKLRGPGLAEYRRELRSLAAGLLPVLAVVAFFKIRFAWHTDLLVTHGVLHRLRGAARYRVVLAAFADGFLHFGDWSLSIPPLLLVYLLLLGVRKQEGRVAVKIGAATLALTALGYFFIYVTAWVPLPWLLQTSLTRLCIQLYPSALFLLFLLARTPEEALKQAST